MRKKLLVFLLVGVVISACVLAFSGCDLFNHQHVFDKQVAESKYLKSEATCTEKAQYYYSCECGENGTETFEYGETISHTYDKQVAESKYLKSEATCTEKAQYYYSCECGEKGEEAFEYGEVNPNAHTFDKQVAQPEYLKSEATYASKAKYYLSCECGKKGEDTFEYGEILKPTEGLNFTLNSEGTAYSVTGLGSATDKDIIVPAKYDGKPVESIGEYAFAESELTSIVIPDSMQIIGAYAFEFCTGLKRVNLGNGLETIEMSAFA